MVLSTGVQDEEAVTSKQILASDGLNEACLSRDTGAILLEWRWANNVELGHGDLEVAAIDTLIT